MTKKLKPLLLENADTPKIWRISITTSNRRWAKMDFGDRQTADNEYNRIRSLGVFGGSWLQDITLESVDDTGQ